ncbi:MAG: hypothetical protein KAY22_08040, partial [Rhizorhabdus sp.]|uniref:hypothetical protein n=1 Tax=Rhizorhabdus sp. TaxID=1968843 RepID=UPI001B464977
MERADLVPYVDILRFGEAISTGARAACELSRRLPIGAAEADALATGIEAAMSSVARRLEHEGGHPSLSAFVPIAALHAAQSYAPVVALMRRGFYPSVAPIVLQALLGHYSACVTGLVCAFAPVVQTSMSAAGFGLSDRLREYLERQIDRFEALLGALSEAGLAESDDERLQYLFKDPWTELRRTIVERICPLILRRLDGGLEPRWLTGSQHKELVALFI